MRNSLRSQGNMERVAPLDEALYHFRLCHACLHLNESDSEVTHCEKCNRIFLSYLQVERLLGREGRTAGMAGDADFDEDEEEKSAMPGLPSRRAPSLQGLSVRW